MRSHSRLRIVLYTLVGVSIALASTAATKPPSAKTMTVDFQEQTSGKAAVVKGTLYFKSPSTVTLVITDPVRQYMIFDEKQTTIYYPGKTDAFRFASPGMAANPYTVPFSGILSSSLSLSKAGFRLARKEIKNGHLTLYWAPPKKSGKDAGDLVVDMVNDEMSSVSVRDSKGRILAKSAFADYVRYKSFAFPLRVEDTVSTGGKMITKTITYTNPKFDVSLPEKIEHFELPAGVKVK